MKKLPGRGRYGDNALNKLAEESSLTKHQTWVFRRFADSDTGYTLQELQELLGLCRKHRYKLPTSFIELLIRVPRTRRRQFERQLVKNRWSFQEAKHKVHDLAGKRRSGGRRHTLPADREGRLRRIEEACASWQRLTEDLLAARNGAALTPAVRQRLRKATAEVSRLLQAAANARRGQAGA